MRRINKIWNKLRLWKLLRRESAAQKMAKQWQEEADELLVSLRAKEKQLQKTIAKFDSQAAIVKSDIEHIEDRETKYEKALEALRNENDVLSNITIPALTAASKLILERCDADMAVQVRRQVAMLPVSHKDELG